MRLRETNGWKLVLGVAVLAVGFTLMADAADVTWDGDSGTAWSTTANWSDDVNGVQAGDNVTFDNTGTQDDGDGNDSVPVTASVDSSITIGKLLFRNIYDYTDDGADVTDQDPDTNWHHLEVQNGQTLTVTNDVIFGVDDVPVIAGGDDEGDVDTTVLISGAGKLVVSNDSTFTVDPLTDRFNNGSQTVLDMSSLAEADITTVDMPLTAVAGTIGRVYFATNTTVTAENIGMSGWNNSRTLYLGETTVLNVDRYLIGTAHEYLTPRSMHTINVVLQTGLTSPTLTMRGQAGGTSRGTMTLGAVTYSGHTQTSLMDLNGATVDAMFDDFVLCSDYEWGNLNAEGVTTFSFDGGTIDATTVKVASLDGVGKAGTAIATLNVGSETRDGGTLIADTIIIGDNHSATDDSDGDGRVNGTINLRGGTIRAVTVTSGGPGAEPEDAYSFNWYNGTIANKAGTNLTMEAGIDYGVLTDSNHTFAVDAGRFIFVDGTVTSAIDASGITLTGAGTLGGTGELACALTVSSGATLQPGPADTPGTLTVSNLTTAAGSTFSVRMNGTSAGQFDQLALTGTGTLGGAFDVTLGYAPDVGERVTIIDKQSAGGVSGRFSNNQVLAAFGGREYAMAVFYNRGDGNDVVLERVPRGTMITIR